MTHRKRESSDISAPERFQPVCAMRFRRFWMYQPRCATRLPNLIRNSRARCGRKHLCSCNRREAQCRSGYLRYCLNSCPTRRATLSPTTNGRTAVVERQLQIWLVASIHVSLNFAPRGDRRGASNERPRMLQQRNRSYASRFPLRCDLNLPRSSPGRPKAGCHRNVDKRHRAL